MRVIFLDVDGVLNCSERLAETPVCPGAAHKGQRIDPRAVGWLKRIVDATDAKIVVSSTWRLTDALDLVVAALERGGIPRETVIGSTPWLPPTEGVGSVVLALPRCEEIKFWLAAHPAVTSFLILDDDEGANVDGHFIRTTYRYGLEEHHIRRAIGLLVDDDTEQGEGNAGRGASNTGTMPNTSLS